MAQVQDVRWPSVWCMSEIFAITYNTFRLEISMNTKNPSQADVWLKLSNALQRYLEIVDNGKTTDAPTSYRRASSRKIAHWLYYHYRYKCSASKYQFIESDLSRWLACSIYFYEQCLVLWRREFILGGMLHVLPFMNHDRYKQLHVEINKWNHHKHNTDNSVFFLLSLMLSTFASFIHAEYESLWPTIRAEHIHLD